MYFWYCCLGIWLAGCVNSVAFFVWFICVLLVVVWCL